MTRQTEETTTTITTPQTVEEKLDVIILHLERMDRRDRMRMWGGALHGLLAVIPMLFFLWSAWYLYEHGDELIMGIAEQSARNAAEYSGQSYEQALEQIRNFFGGQRTQ